MMLVTWKRLCPCKEISLSINKSQQNMVYPEIKTRIEA